MEEKPRTGKSFINKIKAFVDEILAGNNTTIDLLRQAAETIAIVEAEKTSIETCSVVSIKV